MPDDGLLPSDGQWQERAKQAYLTFKPLDGKFDDNVIVQIKNGPMDFQIREPVSPLLAGALKHTNIMMEVQAAHEYTGQASATATFILHCLAL